MPRYPSKAEDLAQAADREAARRRLMRLSTSDLGERDREVLRMRIAGTPLWSIAETLDMDEPEVEQVVAAQLQRTLGYTVTRMDLGRALQLERLEHLLAGHWEKARRGGDAATMNVLRIMERQSRLLGLDAPQKVDITHRLRLLAEREGWDPEALIAEAQAVIKSLPPRSG